MARIVGTTGLAVAGLVGLTLACFGPSLRSERQLAYRDFSDFYYPLYQHVQQEWDAGRLPLWAPEENGGTPMLGNPTSAVLYPGKLIYAALPYPLAAKVYVVAHVLLAFAAMTWLLKSWEVSTIGASLGGLAYAFGAPVLTQYANVVFLVGAAWMPLGFLSLDRWVRDRSPRGLAGLALVLAMQVLGGDPEAAYLTALAGVVLAIARATVGEPPGRGRRVAVVVLGIVVVYTCLLGLEVANLPTPASRGFARPASRPGWLLSPSVAALVGWIVAGGFLAIRARSRTGLGRTVVGLVGAGLLAGLLAGAQLVPTLEFIQQSTRGEPGPGFDIYAQSIHPARVVEWAWPGAFGSTAHRDRKWLAALPPTEDHRIWFTSIYLGGLTLALAVGGMGFRGPRGWMTGLTLFAVLAGFGTFGSPLFWARTLPANRAALEIPEPELPRPDGRLRDGDGSVYWFLATALPGFRSFRYPGKLFIPGALGVAALAGMGFDGLVAGRRKAATGLASALLGIGVVGLAGSWIGGGVLLGYLRGRMDAATSVFGPFDPGGALVDLRWGMVHGSVVMLASLAIVRVAWRRPGLAGTLAVVLMAVDLGLANRVEVATVPQAAYEAESRVLSEIRAAEVRAPGNGPYRIFRLHRWVPTAWNRRGSPDRLEEIVRWERETLRPKYEQPLHLASTYAHGTTELADYGPFFEPFPVQPDPTTTRSLGLAPGARVAYFPRRGFDLWNTRYFVVPTRLSWTSMVRGFGSFLPDAEAIYPKPTPGPEGKAQLERWGLEQDVQVFRNRAAYPRAWVVHQAIPVGEPSQTTREARQRLMVDLLYQDDDLWRIDGRAVFDPRRVAWVEAPASKLVGLEGARVESEPVRVEAVDDPSRVELRVDLASRGLVILADVFYPGWKLEVDGQPTEILRVNRAMRGAIVPAGSHRLVYTYRPASVAIGGGLSGLGILAWLGLWTRSGGRQAVVRKLPGQDSNLEKQDQNLL